MTLDAARASVDPARHLYERVAAARLPITIETFHGWFWQLLARAPLGSGMPFAPALLEATDRLRADAWLHFTAAITRSDHAAERAAWEELIDAVGDFAARDSAAAVAGKACRVVGTSRVATTKPRSSALWRRCAEVRRSQCRAPRARAAVRCRHRGPGRRLVLGIDAVGLRAGSFCEAAQRWLAREDSEDSDSERDFSVICQTLLTKERTVRAPLRRRRSDPRSIRHCAALLRPACVGGRALAAADRRAIAPTRRCASTRRRCAAAAC
jgi:hypothetical protein